MDPSSRDRISVDLRGLRAAVMAQARARGITPSNFVRGVLARACRPNHPDGATLNSMAVLASRDRVRLSLRVSTDQSRCIVAAADAAGIPLGRFVADLVAGVPVIASGAGCADHLAALVASTAEISRLGRNIRHLTSLLRQCEFRPAQEYRPMLDTLTVDVQHHLSLAARALADLQPRRQTVSPQVHPST